MTDIILSLTRTKRAGYIRDLRRLTVALSRARLGLYVVGRAELFSSVLELQPAFEALLARTTMLQIVAGEMYGGVTRKVDDEVVEGGAEIVGLEHLGQYVFEMTQTRVKMLKEGGIALPPAESGQLDDEDDVELEEDVVE
jgi:intron-binding protein aquarius